MIRYERATRVRTRDVRSEASASNEEDAELSGSSRVAMIPCILMPDGIPPYVLVARIGSILGMSFALAIGLLLLIGGWWLPSLIAFAAFIPSFGIMAAVERKASRDRAVELARAAERTE